MARTKVESTPALRSWAEVDNALRELHEAQNKLQEMEAEKNRQIDSVKQDYVALALPLQNRIKRLEADAREFVSAHRAEMDGKSRRLTFGTVGYRMSSRLVVPVSRTAEIIARLKALGLRECVKLTESVDREALKRQPADVLLDVGVSIRQDDEFFYETDHDGMADTAGA